VATKRRISIHKVNLLLDIGIGIAFIVEEQIHWTGIRNHELLGLAFGLALLVHIALHWRWVVTITRHFFRNFFHQSRLRYALNVTIFSAMLVAVVSGVLISRMLTINIPMSFQALLVWGRLHSISSELGLILIGLHVVIHWKWILVSIRKYLIPWHRLSARVSARISNFQAK
jgi:hypothetical protein